MKIIDPEATGGNVAASLGARTRVASLSLPPITGASLPLLDLIDSPFLIPGDDDPGMVAIVETLYVLSEGRKACDDLVGVSRRRRALDRCRTMATSSPAHFEAFLAASERLAAEYEAFSRRALDWWAAHGDVPIADAGMAIRSILEDAFAGFGNIPREEQPSPFLGSSDTGQSG